MDKTISSKTIIITMIARIRSWVIGKSPSPKDVFGVKLTDYNNIFSVDSNGNMKAKFIRVANGFAEYKVPVFFKPNFDSKLSLAQQAAQVLLDKSPVYQEKLLDRSFKMMHKDNLKFVFGAPRKMIQSSYLDLDEIDSSVVVRTATRKLTKAQVVEEVLEQPGDDKLEAYKAYGFVDIAQPVVTRTTWELPFVVKRPSGYVNPSVLAMLNADALNGKEHLLRAYQAGRFDWEDVKDYLPASFEVGAYDYNEVEVESLVDAFIKAERRSSETQGKRLAKLVK
jgi:hypothetical protein